MNKEQVKKIIAQNSEKVSKMNKKEYQEFMSSSFERVKSHIKSNIDVFKRLKNK